ncbi:glutamine--fructose-6-phosphate transaminase (isomerizing) [Propionicimonas sp.]|uniref:glutamine--fructose-6-phosphate transaminase (isomerizing) n=1 Tax=Propionicimonas sp. TaxID=1955623 RepID=UPI0017FEF106|nr:glutamine--fructose-6-phosphate transaminase (isomerizing) [Propionicimonas sp.]MBU3976980.1 glutamine--fructose-6-phosphate transaminase (isomerizing) [Actinomycetota bacterium]MBA3020551.1 glutamine--fructose-6-phosphate transaminase (isomerizing) [Propionicimonas sp.]MBU3986725.1 glutamine--fructose-6-phosphate transaminase (isomerizing) [Actinomycetota bacterium]MBU4007123.1 glutamine--fructose-6-phosphate transaminase (isomerizing) [Actinomycetota bacterium]MBU4064876.1 glutamine--fruc
MCGIIGYVGPRVAHAVVVEGLRRMEYRGYDSAGVAVITAEGISLRKKAGKIANLDALLATDPIPASGTGIGHTRWATHGGPTDVNAHPHVSSNGRVALIHNGIIENFAVLRAELQAQGVEFSSETDTEVAAQLLGEGVAAGADLADAMRSVCRRLEGAFTLVAIDSTQPGRLVAARRNSPLVVGVGEGENFVASDVAAFIEFTRQAIELGQDQMVDVTADSITVTDFDGAPAASHPFEVTWDLSAAEKGGYDWFMRKEIFEQPKAVADTLLGRFTPDGALTLDELRIPEAEIRGVDKIIIVACGTAYYAGLVAKYAIEHWARIACEVEIASEFRYRDPIITGSTLVVTISQSGETADTLMAIRHAREQKAKVIAICNTNGATIPRESDAVIYTHAGPEIGVASTKGFLTQVAACYLLGLYLAQVRGSMYDDEIRHVMTELAATPPLIQQVLDSLDQITDLAARFVDTKSVLFLGRHVGYPIALEGALKLKELAYLHAEGFPAGELKHGPIALVEEGVPIFIVVPPQGRDQLHDKVVSNIQEVRARGALTIVLAEEGDEEVVPYADVLFRLPKVSTLLQPLVATVPLQMFACELATLKGYDVDQPRNLAKSVTVE